MREWFISNSVTVKQRQAIRGNGHRGSLRATITKWLGRAQEVCDSQRRLYKIRMEEKGEFAGTTYIDKKAYNKAVERGEKDIRYEPPIRY